MNFYSKIKKEKDIEKHLKLKLLGTVPIYSDKIQNIEDGNKEKLCIEESINDIRKNISTTSLEKDKAILITSCHLGEGKSWIAVNIGASFTAINKKVILVVADMLKDKIYENCDMELLKKYIEKTSVPNFDILTDRGVQFNSSKLSEKNNIKKLIEQLKGIYDIIILDGLSSNLVKDSVLLSKAVDSTILVANSEKTKIRDLKDVRNSIQTAGGRIIGVILNKYKVEDTKKANKTISNNKKSDDKPKQNSKEQNRIYLKSIINKQNKHIEKLEKIIAKLNKKLDNNQKIENAIKSQEEKYIQELNTNTSEIKKIIEEKNNESILEYHENTEKIMEEFNKTKEEINKLESKINENIQEKIEQEITKMQENMKDEIRQEVISTQERINDTKIKIKKEAQEKIDKMQKEIKTETKEELSKIQEEMKKEIDKIQGKIQEETQKQISKINKETKQNINKIQEEMLEIINKTQEERQEVKDTIKPSTKNNKITSHPIDKDIMYEDLEKTAAYVISLEKENKPERENEKELKESKEYKFKMRYIYGKYFKRDKIYN